MILLNKSNNSESIIVTLNESSIITNGYYLFVFTNVTTKEITNLLVSTNDDISNYKSRFNEFVIDTSTIFTTAKTGQYQYQVYQQLSDTNTDITGLDLVECGKMLLKENETEIYIGDEPTTAYKTYGN